MRIVWYPSSVRYIYANLLINACDDGSGASLAFSGLHEVDLAILV